ncbi:15-hydroxyprostaglandin dehydrogenase [NAD(+)] [Armadillidium nasatum]|uniref:15-hydroxyprostaglandin dehydrogenase [NAD(+)] n=1 Tax=Armadillidium nasatum TaxID=96803 RepID=A0A5N5SS02_9CRUS|nr:15-hydroxyprostaglandin dehydrogenase [NAD(+)] [Armadillidium nasatum]
MLVGEECSQARSVRMGFKGKVALITGGSGGVGEAVCISDINEKQGKVVLKKLQSEFSENDVIFLRCDVGDEKDFEDCYNATEAQLGTIDILCNNAGILSTDYDSTMRINVEAVVKGTEFALKRMGKHKGGKGGFIVNTGSIMGLFQNASTPLYSTSKAFVIHYSRDVGFIRAPKHKPEDLAKAFVQIIEDKKPGSVLLSEKGQPNRYIPPSVSHDF